MDFEDGARLDTSQVDDARGRGRGKGLAVGGGGGLGIIGLVLYLFLGGGGGGDLASVLGEPGARQEGSTSTSDLDERCQTGADADREEDCLVVGVVNSVQEYWDGQLGSRYTPSDTQLFAGSTTTGCGSATSAVGPFYCPADDTIYVDLGFFDELSSTYGASGGDFAKAYVLAHEYGHHVQDLLGTSERVQRSRGETGPQSPSVRLELQADCYAGAWAKGAVATRTIKALTEKDISDGLSAAAAVGDDRIQEKSSGRVDPESWSHGSAEQRQRWFGAGYATGDPRSCDTFKGRV